MASMFIVFDGVDGAGKSTQLQLAAQWFHDSGRDVLTCADPGSTELGQRIRQLLLGQHDIPVSMRSEMLLFMTARAQLVDELVRPALAANKVVLCDRYTFSTVVYQGHAGGMDPAEIWTVNQVATGGLVPDLTLLFDMPVPVALQRIGARRLDRMESRGEDFLERVRQGFLLESQRWPKGVEIVPAGEPVDAVFARVKVHLAAVADRHREADG